MLVLDYIAQHLVNKFGYYSTKEILNGNNSCIIDMELVALFIEKLGIHGMKLSNETLPKGWQCYLVQVNKNNIFFYFESIENNEFKLKVRYSKIDFQSVIFEQRKPVTRDISIPSSSVLLN